MIKTILIIIVSSIRVGSCWFTPILTFVGVILTFWHSFWHTTWEYSICIYIRHIYSDILSYILSSIYCDILSEILSGIYSDIVTRIYSDILSGILSDILSGLWLKSGSAHWDLAVLLRSCTRCWDPAVPTEIGSSQLTRRRRMRTRRRKQLWSNLETLTDLAGEKTTALYVSGLCALPRNSSARAKSSSLRSRTDADAVSASSVRLLAALAPEPMGWNVQMLRLYRGGE